MANYEHLIAQLSSIAENPAKLDGDTRKRIIDATKLISSKLLTQSPIEQVGALNEPCVQIIDPWLLYKGSTNMNIVAAPLELDIAPGTGEARTDGPRIVGFSQQSAEAVPLSFVSHYEHESLSHSSMDTSSDQQHVQDFYSSTAELDRCHDWLPTGPDYIASLSNPVDPSSFNDNYHIPDLITTTNDPFTLDPTANLYNDFDATVPLGSRTVTNTSPISMNCGLTINGFNSSHSASHTTDISQNARHLASPPIDRSETSSTYFSRWSARLIPGLDIGPSILEGPVGTDSSLRRKESPMLDEIQQFAFHGRTTPEVYLDSSSPNTTPALVATRLANNALGARKDHEQNPEVEHIAFSPENIVTRTETQSRGDETQRRLLYLQQRPPGCMYKLSYDYASFIGTTAIEISPCVDSLGEDNMLPFLGDDEMFYAVQFSFTENYCTPTVKENGILPVGLRALDELAAWGRDNLRTRPRSLPDDCVNAVLIIVRRPDLYHRRRLKIEDMSRLIDAHLSQFGWLLKRYRRGQRSSTTKGFVETEKELLAMLDEQMKCERNRRRPNSVILGLCIRRLSLSYRDSLRQNRRLYRRFESINPRGFADNAKRMYDGCISAYSKVYWKGESPYSASWRLEDHIEEFGNDAALVEMFGGIMRAERKYCEALTEKDEDEDDKALKKLFLDAKQRGEKSWSG
ncbi:MAG: hypothetical protein Q9175_004708 [Cornicularia normoerica]